MAKPSQATCAVQASIERTDQPCLTMPDKRERKIRSRRPLASCSTKHRRTSSFPSPTSTRLEKSKAESEAVDEMNREGRQPRVSREATQDFHPGCSTRDPAPRTPRLAHGLLITCRTTPARRRVAAQH